MFVNSEIFATDHYQNVSNIRLNKSWLKSKLNFNTSPFWYFQVGARRNFLNVLYLLRIRSLPLSFRFFVRPSSTWVGGKLAERIQNSNYLNKSSKGGSNTNFPSRNSNLINQNCMIKQSFARLPCACFDLLRLHESNLAADENIHRALK